MGFLPICPRAASMPHPLRAIPDKCCGARRGKRDKITLLSNVSLLVMKGISHRHNLTESQIDPPVHQI